MNRQQGVRWIGWWGATTSARLGMLALLAIGCTTSVGLVLTEASDLSPVALEPGERLRVAATSSIIADIVSAVGGEEIELIRLIPVGADPHSYEPTPRDLALVSSAHVLFANGLGLEGPLLGTLSAAEGRTSVVFVSAYISPRILEPSAHIQELEGAARPDPEDPHVWLDPNHVMAWTRAIEVSLTALRPESGAVFRRNAEDYRVQLHDLDEWIRAEVRRIPPESRLLVTDHDSLGYFADRYGFEIAGSVTGGFSTLAEPSAQELADLQERIARQGVKAVYVETSVNPAVAARMAEDAGIIVLPLYVGSLSSADGPAATYLDMMRYNVATIVRGLV